MLFLLQQGHGMMELDKDFLADHGQSGVILSPRVYNQGQVERHSEEILALGGQLLFDPQFYEPRTNIERIVNYPYWHGLDFDSSDFIIHSAQAFCERVINYQIESLDVSKVIIPGRYTNSADGYWRDLQSKFSEVANTLNTGRQLYSTVAIGPDVVLSGELFDTVIDEIILYPVNGIYLVFRPPLDSFLIENDLFLYSLLDGLLSIAVSGKDIILGYSNQQNLIYAAAGVSTIASGNFRNVRHFNPTMFYAEEPEVITRRTWYYDSNTLSEFRLENMQLAIRRGFGKYFGPSCEHCEPLLRSGAIAPWSEPQAFRHYLHEMHRQWLAFSTAARRERSLAVTEFFNNVKARTEELNRNHFTFGDRAFNNAIDPCLNALTSFGADRARDIALL
jgi:hypothetical protein